MTMSPLVRHHMTWFQNMHLPMNVQLANLPQTKYT